MAKCTSCGAEIEFVKAPSGRFVPVQKVTSIYVVEEDDAGHRRLAKLDPAGGFGIYWISHFQTCPNAAQHSRGRR